MENEDADALEFGIAPAHARNTMFSEIGHTHLLLRAKLKIRNIPTGHVFLSKSDPYESSGHTDTGKLHRIMVQIQWD